jgi:formiminotetrahydrofolate cyclodeaminase
MKPFKDHTLKEYLDQLAARQPVPGGGSAAALSSALGAGLIIMVTQYSLGKGKPKAVESKFGKIIAKAEKIRERLLALVDEDAQAYLGVVAARKQDVQAQKLAARRAAKVPREICTLSYEAVELTPFIVEHGNPYLMSDVEVALELLLAGYHSAIVMVKANQ